MMMPIRRPVRPPLGPLRDRMDNDAQKRPDCVWLRVRYKRSRAAASVKAKLAIAMRGPTAAANET
jgi:hypothetical protein